MACRLFGAKPLSESMLGIYQLELPNGRRGVMRPPTCPIGLKVEAAMASAEITVE